MRVIAVLNPKGGSGKTTLAVHIANALQQAGHDVLLIDSDPQGSARDWAAANRDQSLPVAGVDRPVLERDVKALGRGRDFVVIDGCPRMQAMTASALAAADLVVIPVQPSPLDIWAASELVTAVQDRELAGLLVINRAVPRAHLPAEARLALVEFGIPVATTQIGSRVVYPAAMARGLTVLDTHDLRAKAEIHALTTEIINQLKEGA